MKVAKNFNEIKIWVILQPLKKLNQYSKNFTQIKLQPHKTSPVASTKHLRRKYVIPNPYSLF